MILTPIYSLEISNVKPSGHHLWTRRLGRGRGQILRCPERSADDGTNSLTDRIVQAGIENGSMWRLNKDVIWCRLQSQHHRGRTRPASFWYRYSAVPRNQTQLCWRVYYSTEVTTLVIELRTNRKCSLLILSCFCDMFWPGNIKVTTNQCQIEEEYLSRIRPNARLIPDLQGKKTRGEKRQLLCFLVLFRGAVQKVNYRSLEHSSTSTASHAKQHSLRRRAY